MENELCFRLAAWLLPIVEQILQGYCLCRLAKPFMNSQGRSGARFVWAAYSLTMLALYAMKRSPNNSAVVSIGIAAALIVMCRTDRRNYGQKVFLAVTLFSLCWSACAITEIVYDYVYYLASNTVYMKNHPAMFAELYVVMCMIYLLLKFSILSVSIWCILKVYVYKSANMTKKELCMLSAPLFMGTGGFEIIQYYRTFYIVETGGLTDEYDARAVVYYTVSIIVVIVVIGLYQNIKARQEDRLQNELLAVQMDSMRHHIGQVESLYQSIRGIRHDMANHIMTLEALYAGNQVEEAREYSASLKSALAGAGGEIRSGNPVTDVILQEWKQEAKKRGIRFQSDFYYPTGSDIDAFDVSVILNNALENAVENTTEYGLVSIRCYHRNNAYMIEVSNSFAGTLQWDMESGLPVTSKRETEGHGYGVSNMRRVAAKYAGDIAINVKEGTFCLCVMLIL